MRFARVYTRSDTHEIVAVFEQETPFERFGLVQAIGPPLVMHELGLVEHFEPTTIEGEPCSPAQHLFERIAHHDPASGPRPFHGFGAKPGYVLPPVIDCPTTIDGVKQRLRERGIAGLSVKARAWLTLMLPPDERRALGVDVGVPISALRALDAMRARRDPEVGHRAVVLERKAQEQADKLSVRQFNKRMRAAARAQAAEEVSAALRATIENQLEHPAKRLARLKQGGAA